MKKHAAIYMRVSTKRQDTQSQEPDLKRWAETHDGEVRWYRDTFTGTSMDRPGLSRLLHAVASGQVSDVVVWRLDRLGRTAKGLTALFDDLIKCKINLVSLKDGLDLSTPAGRLMANILASAAAYETEVRAERILAGQEAARARGVTWGGSKPGRRIKVKAEQVDVILRMVAEDKPITAMARATGLSRPTVYRLINESQDEHECASAGCPSQGDLAQAG
jgi:DNA invertase Pin-like site-specific DNA recombinase